MLRKILGLRSGVVMVSGGARRITGIYLRAWGKGRRVLVESPEFALEGDFFIGDPLNSPGFDVYLVLNPVSGPKERREKTLRWLEGLNDKLVLLYEERYVGDSIARYKIRKHLDYLIAYRRETMGAELLKVYRLENGRVVERKTYVRRPMTSGFGSER